jgi:hypothetical protein
MARARTRTRTRHGLRRGRGPGHGLGRGLGQGQGRGLELTQGTKTAGSFTATLRLQHMTKQKQTTAVTEKTQEVTIKPVKIRTNRFILQGMTPYLQNGWTDEAVQKIRTKQAEGSASARKRVGKEARKFEGAHLKAMHVSTEGWPGIPTGALRAALISACKLVGFAMTQAKLAIDIQPDGFDQRGSGLVKINGEPQASEMLVTNATGVCDIRCRPIWKQWDAEVTVVYDGDLFSPTDISNLVVRAGLQVGIGAGRPDSKKSNGLGLGKFTVGTPKQEAA